MITQEEYKKYPETYWKGITVITLREIKNGWYDIPPGTKLKITRKYKGFSLDGLEVCEHCKIGRVISISRVETSALRVTSITEEEDKTYGKSIFALKLAKEMEKRNENEKQRSR